MFLQYKPRIYVKNIIWRLPNTDQIKCNCDGASKGNQGESFYSFCIRNHHGDLIWAETNRIGTTSNNKAEAMTILMCLRFYRSLQSSTIILETNSFAMKSMLNKEWKIPWELVDIMEEAIQLKAILQVKIEHVFQEGNLLADALAASTFQDQEKKEYCQFQQLLPHASNNY